MKLRCSRRRLGFAAAALLLLGAGVLLWSSFLGAPRYLASSRVILSPYTNALRTRSFEEDARKAIPTVFRLTAVLTLSAIPGAGLPVTTNGVMVEILVLGASTNEAIRIAGEAAPQLLRFASERYGCKGEIVMGPRNYRPYSFFHDDLQLKVERLLKP